MVEQPSTAWVRPIKETAVTTQLTIDATSAEEVRIAGALRTGDVARQLPQQQRGGRTQYYQEITLIERTSTGVRHIRLTCPAAVSRIGVDHQEALALIAKDPSQTRLILRGPDGQSATVKSLAALRAVGGRVLPQEEVDAVAAYVAERQRMFLGGRGIKRPVAVAGSPMKPDEQSAAVSVRLAPEGASPEPKAKRRLTPSARPPAPDVAVPAPPPPPPPPPMAIDVDAISAAVTAAVLQALQPRLDAVAAAQRSIEASDKMISKACHTSERLAAQVDDLKVRLAAVKEENRTLRAAVTAADAAAAADASARAAAEARTQAVEQEVATLRSLVRAEMSADRHELALSRGLLQAHGLLPAR